MGLSWPQGDRSLRLEAEAPLVIASHRRPGWRGGEAGRAGRERLSGERSGVGAGGVRRVGEKARPRQARRGGVVTVAEPPRPALAPQGLQAWAGVSARGA